MTTLRSYMKKLLLISLALLILLSLGFVFPLPQKTEAATTLSFSATTVAQDAFKVTVTFPVVNWGGFEFTLKFDPSVLQLAGRATKSNSEDYEISWQRPDPTAANSSGEYSVTGAGDPLTDMSNSGLVITFPFTVKSSTATTTTITLEVTTFIDKNNNPLLSSAPSPLTVTLRQGSTTTDTSGSGSSSGSQSSGSQSSGSQSSGTTNTGSGSAGTSDTPSVNSSSSKPTSSANPSSNPVSSNPETSDTGTETDTQITDTESGFEISQTETDAGTGTEGAPPVTDTNDAPSGTTTGISASADTSTQKPKGGLDLSTSAIAIISLSVAAFICCLLTLAGFLRHKKD